MTKAKTKKTSWILQHVMSMNHYSLRVYSVT